MKKVFLYLFALLLISGRAFATTYYVDPAGNDSNNGTSAATAWQTLTKVNAATFSPGDNILFIKGGVWVGSIKVKTSGTTGSPVTWGSYGAGANPVISGFITASGWVNAGGGIWTYTNAALGSTTPNIVTINGVVTPLGRFPKTTNNVYTAHTGKTSITDPTLSGSPSYTGGDVVIRTVHWALSRGKITSQSGGTINYSSTSNYTPTNGFSYFIQNNINCLTQFGDWCYNTSTNTISLYFGSAAPSDYTIKISSLAALISLPYGTSNQVFNGINFEGADYAFQGTNNTRISITGCTINAIGHNAIDFGYSNYLTITGNTINDCNNDAIACWYGTNNCVISSNTINRAGAIPGAGENDTGLNNEGAYCGINVNGNSNTFQYNNINKTGYNGLEADGDGFLVDENFIDSACAVNDDGGGIYTYTGATAVVYKGRTISNNIVLNSLGVPPAAGQANQGNGIYLDDNSSNITVTGNTVANCGQDGYFLHNAHETVLTNNLSYNNALTQLMAQYDNDVPALTGKNKNLTITGNTLIANISGQHTLEFESFETGSSIADFKTFGASDNNHNGSLSSNTMVFFKHLEPSGVEANINLASWRTLSAQDANSTFLIPTYTAVNFQYNASTTAKSISLTDNYIDIQSNPYSGTVSLKPYSSFVLFDTGVKCAVAQPTIIWSGAPN